MKKDFKGIPMKRICVIGHFGFGFNLLNGQTIKTKIVTKALEDKVGTSEVQKIDTHGGKSAYLRLPIQMLKGLKECSNIIIFPAHNGVRVIVPLLVFLNYFFKRKIHYIVIGGWLPNLCKKKKWLSEKLKAIDSIYVETNTMKSELEKQGFQNIIVMPNFKNLSILDENELVYSEKEPFALCTFSRVMKEKGIEDAIEAVISVNSHLGRIAYTLDIYGQVDMEQEEWFEVLKKSFPKYVRYKGCVPFEQAVDVLKSYFALLFPTRFFTEGIPGTIIDAYAAGVPVIVSKWESSDDVIEEKTTGLCYEFFDEKGLYNILRDVINNPTIVNSMKVACIKKANSYISRTAINKIDLK